MADLSISNAASLDHSTIATGDLLPVVDVSAANGSKGSKITVGELTTTVNGVLLGASNIFTASGAASSPALSLTGSVFTGGTSTTTKPFFLIEPGGTASTGWSTSGTLLGLNAASGFTGDFISTQSNGSLLFSITSSGRMKWGPIGGYGITPVLFVEGTYANVTWWQGGAGNVATFHPLEVSGWFTVQDPSNGALFTKITWNNINTVYSSSNGQFVYGTAPMGIGDTDGFFCLRSCPGTPTGAPASLPEGAMPIVYDSTNNKIMVYNGGWKSTAALT